MNHNVHLYVEVRLKLSGIEADTHAEASEKAQAMVADRLHDWIDLEMAEDLGGAVAEYVEYTEGGPHLVLVDQLNDAGQVEDESSSVWLDAEGNPVDPAGSSESATPPLAAGWQPFDYSNAEPGLYWVRGEYPEMDGDVDGSGQPVGWPTGKLLPFSELVSIETYGDGQLNVIHIARIEFCGGGQIEAIPVESPDFDETYRIAEYMPFVTPK